MVFWAGITEGATCFIETGLVNLLGLSFTIDSDGTGEFSLIDCSVIRVSISSFKFSLWTIASEVTASLDRSCAQRR